MLGVDPFEIATWASLNHSNGVQFENSLHKLVLFPLHQKSFVVPFVGVFPAASRYNSEENLMNLCMAALL